MRIPMCITLSSRGVSITYKCYRLPGHGRKCPDKNTDVCLTCKYSKAEMSGRDATKLLNGHYATHNGIAANTNEEDTYV